MRWETIQLWRAERWWFRHSWAAWALWSGTLAVAVSVGAGAAWDAHRQRQVLVQLQADTGAAKARAREGNLGDGLSPTDFAQTLGSGPAAPAVLQDLQRVCSEAAVALVLVQVVERPATPEQLGRLEFTAALRGSYVGTHQVVKHLSERFPGASVPRLRMRHGAQPGEIETSLVLAVWSAPSRAR